MRFTILEYGTLKLSEYLLVDCGTKEQIEIPVLGVLMQTEGHNVIYDLGCMEKCMEGEWEHALTESMPYSPNPKGIDGLLAEVGLTCQDIDTIIVSHLHPDHFGLITRFPHADVYVSEEEWVSAMKQVFGKCSARKNPQAPYYYRCMSAPVKEYHFVNLGENFLLFQGLEIFTLSGHTENLLGIKITTNSGKKYLFASDMANTSKNFFPSLHLPGSVLNKDDYKKSLEQLVRIRENENATLFYSHDMAFFSTLKKCPEWYE